MRVSFLKRQELAPTIWQYYFRPDRQVDFVPGQYIDLHLPVGSQDPRGSTRTFTLTSLPSETFISFIVKSIVPASPYKQCLADLQPDDEAKIDTAMGDLVLPKSLATPLVFAGGGIGIASFASMARWLQETGEVRNISLFYALRDSREAVLQNVFTNFHTSVITAPERLSASQLRQNQTSQTLYYLSGSQAFVENLRQQLASLSIAHENIVFDYFEGYAEL